MFVNSDVYFGRKIDEGFYLANLHYDNWHLHDGCQGGNDTSTKLLHCEKASACTRRVSANCHNAN